MHSEELSKQYLDTIKKDLQVDTCIRAKATIIEVEVVAVDVAKGDLIVESET